MKKGRIPSVILMTFLSGWFSFARFPGKPPEVDTVRDTLFVRSSGCPSAEVDELVLLSNGRKTILFAMGTADGSSLTFDHTYGGANGYSSFLAYNNGAGGNSYLIVSHTGKKLFMTYGWYPEVDLVPGSVDFTNRTVWLKNRYPGAHPADTLFIGRETGYIISKAAILVVELREIEINNE